MIAIGLALLRRPLATRGTALALLVILLLLLGVFLPTFAMQVLNGGLVAGNRIDGANVVNAWFLYERSQRSRPAPVAGHADNDFSIESGGSRKVSLRRRILVRQA